MRVKHWSSRRVLSHGLLQLSFFGISEGLMNRLQSFQNAAARLVTDTRRSKYITLMLHAPSATLATGTVRQRQRIDFKVATLVHRSLSGISPSYLANDRRLVADAHDRRLYVPQQAEHALCVTLT